MSRKTRTDADRQSSQPVKAKPKPKITDAAVCEIFFRHSQCVFAQKGARHPCPMPLFSKQIADELNEFFEGDD